MEPKAKKGLIIGGSVLGVVLIIAGIGTGLYFGLRDTNPGIHVWGYDDQVSSTAKKVDWYMGTETNVVTGTYGGVALSSELALKENSHYHSVLDDIDILDGVAGSNTGLGYLSSAWVSGYDGEELRMLNLETKDGYLDPTAIGDKEDYAALEANHGVETEGSEHTYTEEDSVGIKWRDISDDERNKLGLDSTATRITGELTEKETFTTPEDGIEPVLISTTYSADAVIIDGIVHTVTRVDNVVGDDEITNKTLTKGTEEMKSQLNIHLKVPEVVADTISGTGIISETALTGDFALTAEDTRDVSKESAKYFENLDAKGYTDDLVLSIALFDYMAYDQSNLEAVKDAVIEGTNKYDGDNSTSFDDKSLENFSNLYNEWHTSDDSTFIEALKNQQKDNSGSYLIKVDGTGTNSGLVKSEIARFQDEFNDAAGTDLVFEYDLVNGGSGEGWKGTKANELDGVPYNEKNDGRSDAFLGTQSRASEASEIDAESGWGYNGGYDPDEGTYQPGIEAGSGNYQSPEKRVSGQVIGYTMGLDLPVFFVREAMTIDYTVVEGDELNFVEGDSAEVGETIKVKPTGINAKAAREFYQDKATWQEEISSGDVQIEIV